MNTPSCPSSAWARRSARLCLAPTRDGRQSLPMCVPRQSLGRRRATGSTPMQLGKIRRATGETAAVLIEAGQVLTLDLYRRPDVTTLAELLATANPGQTAREVL